MQPDADIHTPAIDAAERGGIGISTVPHAGRRLALVSVAGALVAAASYVLTVLTETGQLVGEVMLGGRPASAEAVASAEQVLAVLSRSSLILGTVTVVGIALAQRRPRLAVVAALAIVGANVTTQLLKQLVLDRTDLLGGLFYALPNSFPSGHATAAASIAVGLLLVLPPLLRAPSVVLSAVVVAIVGISTLVAGWHRMADAAGGVFVATAWGAGLAGLLVWRTGVEGVGRRTATFGRLTASLPLSIGAALLALGSVIYVIVAFDPLEVLLFLADRGGSPALFGVAVLITVGTSLLALGTLGYALRDIRLDPRPGPTASPARTDDKTGSDTATAADDAAADRASDPASSTDGVGSAG